MVQVTQLGTGYLHIIFDGPPGPEAGRFVECENPAGESVNAGEWSERADGLWELIIPTQSQAENAAKDAEIARLKSACDGWRVQFEMSRESLEVARSRIGELEAVEAQLRICVEDATKALPVLVAMLKSARLGKGANVAIAMLDDARTALANHDG